jgi:hypothetical protein
MENNPVSRYTVSFGLSLVVSSFLNALLVIAKEKSPAVQAGMQKLTGHHWVTHSLVVMVFFVLFGWSLAQVKGGKWLAMPVTGLIKTIIAGVLAAGLIIIGFYLLAD